MGRGIPNDLADTTKPGCEYILLYIALYVKTIPNLAYTNKCSSNSNKDLKMWQKFKRLRCKLSMIVPQLDIFLSCV